ncbi:hypothetical protein GCM10023093_30960 [Nemorincola caseinilytica]|uniref:Uncharacterized protein n=2 Tax=Nemorincola caseinilytica TaxID=2054315 RepID=A0ABP8NNG7_9BACT
MCVGAAVPSLTQIRELYYRANENKKAADRFYTTMQAVDDREQPLLTCYKGMAAIMRVKYGIEPFSRLAGFQKGKGLVEQAVGQAPANVEVRFLRFCVQSQVPRILMYSSDMAADRTFILQAYPQLADNDLRKRIKEYMLRYGDLTPNEKRYLQ